MSDGDNVGDILRRLRDERGLHMMACRAVNLRLRIESKVHLLESVLAGKVEIGFCSYVNSGCSVRPNFTDKLLLPR